MNSTLKRLQNIYKRPAKLDRIKDEKTMTRDVCYRSDVNMLEFVGEADGAEFECDRVFQDGELVETPKIMERLHGTAEQTISK